MPRATSKLKKVLGEDCVDGTAPMRGVPEAQARPGAWKTMLLPAKSESEIHKGREVPLAIDDAIVQDVADGGRASEIENRYEVPAGYVRRVLIRKFGSIEGMKKALQAQCLENAIALGEYAMERIEQIAPSQALAGSKLMIDSALALGKASSERPTTVDFASLAALGATLERLEKVVTGTDRTIDV